MFGEIEYKLLISGYMSREEYIQLIKNIWMSLIYHILQQNNIYVVNKLKSLNMIKK